MGKRGHFEQFDLILPNQSKYIT